MLATGVLNLGLYFYLTKFALPERCPAVQGCRSLLGEHPLWDARIYPDPLEQGKKDRRHYLCFCFNMDSDPRTPVENVVINALTIIALAIDLKFFTPLLMLYILISSSLRLGVQMNESIGKALESKVIPRAVLALLWPYTAAVLKKGVMATRISLGYSAPPDSREKHKPAERESSK